jgi:acetyl-CoA acetyltransferase
MTASRRWCWPGPKTPGADLAQTMCEGGGMANATIIERLN